MDSSTQPEGLSRPVATEIECVVFVLECPGPNAPGPSPSGPNPPGLLSYDQVPEAHRDNPYIHHGYRPISNSIKSCLASWFHLHNETINIISYLLPAVLSLVAAASLYRILQRYYPGISQADYVVFVVFLLTVALCLGISAMAHTMMSHSVVECEFWLRVDFFGSLTLIYGCIFSGLHMIFYCEPGLENVYGVVSMTLCSVANVLILTIPPWRKQEWRIFRVCTLVITVLCGCVPVLHGVAVFGTSQMKKQSGMLFYLLEGFLLILGVLVHITRFPESLKPGGFDIFGSSHQILHLLVVLATVIHFIGMLLAFDYNFHHRVCIAL